VIVFFNVNIDNGHNCAAPTNSMQYPTTTRRASEYGRRPAKLTDDAQRVRDDGDRRHLLDLAEYYKRPPIRWRWRLRPMMRIAAMRRRARKQWRISKQRGSGSASRPGTNYSQPKRQ
jgi:hypothetical protein